MSKNKILRTNEFQVYQEVINHCHLTEVMSDDIRLARRRTPILECGDPVGQSASGIIILPSSVKETEKNVGKISKIVREHADKCELPAYNFSIGYYFAGDYTSADDSAYTADSLCVGLSDGLGDIPTILMIGAKLMQGFRLPSLLIVAADTIMEVGMDGAVKKEGRQIKGLD